MKIKSIISGMFVTITCLVTVTSCQKGDLVDNPNIASASTAIPSSLILNHLTATLIRSVEFPWGDAYKTDQYFVANYSYYRGTNFYTFGNTNDDYDILKYAIALDNQSTKQLGNQTNKYFALSQFFRAYSGIWLSQRVGDIPFSQAGDPANLLPKFDAQHDVYKTALAQLDKANSVLGALNATASVANAPIDPTGDIFGLTSLQWQKLVNTYRLRVLISLSKRASDNADLQIPQQFATIINNPAQYPIMASNSDNLVYKFNTTSNTYPLNNNPYNNYANISKTFLDITTADKDPRTFAIATPAPALLTGKTVSDFSVYAGSDINIGQGTLLANSVDGLYSFANYNRYYTSVIGANAEPFTLISYAEMCFNIAEAINRGWVTTQNSGTWYLNGINASLSFFGLTDGQTYTVADLAGKTLGTTTINYSQFLTNANVVYKGDNATGLAQILTQKYVAMFNNSGFEAYYNFRRTGIPAFAQGGAGIGTPNNQIPRRWLYPSLEITYNSSNYQSSIGTQFGGVDDVSKDTWLTK